jgi:hypothetical protein
MPSKAVVFVLASFVLAVLIFSLYCIPDVFARINKGAIVCQPFSSNKTINDVLCCQKQTDSSSGLEITYCTICADTVPPSNCGPRFTVREGSVNTTGVIAPLGPNAPPTGNNAGTLPPPVSVIKAPPGAIGNATNPITASKSGVYSPTGGCSTSSKSQCIPCDPGIPTPYCIPSSDWPAGLRTAVNPTGVVAPLGNLTNAPPTGSNTGTPPPPPPTKQVGPGCGPGTDNSTCSTSTHNPLPIQKGSNLGSSTSSGNSTGH